MPKKKVKTKLKDSDQERRYRGFGLILFMVGIATDLLAMSMLGIVYMLKGYEHLEKPWNKLDKKGKTNKGLVIALLIITAIMLVLQAITKISAIIK